MPSFTQQQIQFTLSLLSNLGAGSVGSVDDLETTLAAAINKQLQDLQGQIGSWKIVWGPAIFQEISSVRADNTMFVAQSGTDPAQYVISIAGTNFYSAYDWVIEDVFVARQVPWEYGNPPVELNPALADGTHRGLSIVQQLIPGPTLPGNALPLQTFLKQLPSGGLNIIVAGHSLGGALSPVTALWLSDTKSQWDPTNRATLSCLPSAGPTPGNKDFATYYQNSTLGKNTTRIYNSIDVVPHAWATADLAEVPTLYSPNIQPDALIKVLAFAASQASKDGNYAQLNSDPPLPGTFAPLPPIVVSNSFPDFQNFVQQLAYQHVDAYLVLQGLDQLSPLLKAARDSAVTGLKATLPVLIKNLLRRLAVAQLQGITIS